MKIKSAFICLFLCCVTLGAQNQKVENGYVKREVKIEMRDGVKLHTTIYQPVDCGEGRPVIMRRTPYSCSPYGEEFRTRDLFEAEMKCFTDHKYIVVYQDVRGRFNSEGSYMNIRPLSGDVNDVTDTYDTIEWLVNNTPNNGNVGMCGISYPGYYSMVGALCGHPALKACSPQAPIGDWFIGDDIHHNGAYMLLDTDDFGGTSVFADREAFAAEPYEVNIDYGQSKFDYYERLHTTKKIIGAYGDEETLRKYYPFWYQIINHPNYDEFWKSVAHLPYIKDVKPAILVVGALFDAEDCYGAIQTYKTLLKESPQTETYYVNGPWIHGSWTNRSYDHLGAWYFGEGLFDFFFDEVEYPFFAHYLEGAPEKPAAVTLIPSFASQDTTSHWTSFTKDKMPEYKMKKMPFRRRFSRKSSYVSDPAKPLRYLHPSKKNVRDRSYMADNYVDDSTAFVNFDYKPVEDTVFLCGPIDVDLRYRTTAEDLDFIVKVLDVSPDGSEMLIRGDVFRARYAKSFEEPHFLRPGHRERLQFTLDDVIHYLLPGHSIRVQIQSTWFPLVDINPQTAVENIYKAEESDYKAATITILHNIWNRSSISLPIAQRGE